MTQSFVRVALGDGVTAHILTAPRFKTVTLSVYLHRPLRRETVTANALLPQVLLRGSRELPTLAALARRLDELFGASVSSGAEKIGEDQAIAFHLNVVDDRFLPEGQAAWRAAVRVLAGLIRDPLLEGGAFRADYVEQEKANLGHRIQSLYNDKARYANMRLIAEMCAGEPFALHPLGFREDLEELDPRRLVEHHRSLLDAAPVDVFLVGGERAEDLLPALQEAFAWDRGVPEALPPTRAGEPPAEPRVVVERQPVQQGKLAMGYRAGVTIADPLYFAFVMYNGILGGFVHSKLFRNVREKASLAYYASSHADALKGIMLVASGIESRNYERAVGIIQEQVAAMERGDITDDELEFTRRALIERLRAASDSPAAMISGALAERLGGRPMSQEERIAGIEAVRKDDVVEVAHRVRLDTIFFLTHLEDDRSPAASAPEREVTRP
ncbi:MAG: insulinase family protein [Clostridia bacterium]|nr:insulinase family protein [Clostridia bacterium]